MADNKKPPQKKPQNSSRQLFAFIALAVIFTLLINWYATTVSNSRVKEITYTEFLQMVDDDTIDNVKFYADRMIITPKRAEADTEKTDNTVSTRGDLYRLFTMNQREFSEFLSGRKTQKEEEITYYTGNVGDYELVQLLKQKGITMSAPVENRNLVLEFFLNWVLPILIFYAILSFFMSSMSKNMNRGGFMGGLSKSNAKIYIEKKTGVTFKDVAGQEEAKESLLEIVDFLNNPKKYTEIGAKQPKGALLVGPPGTGKTLLAKAIAGEASVPFFSLSGSDFVEMFVGLGASRVRDLFKEASAQAPCIVFIDEIDAIGKSREGNLGGNDEREQTLNQLLAEMDGFDSSKGVVILGATNRPEVLDKALLRPGRFDRRVIVEKPDLKGRKSILEVHSKDVKMDTEIDLHEIALATSGAAGADLANMVNEAALRAVRLGRDKVKQEDLMEAVEIIIAGKEKKDRVLSEKEKRLVAYHEVGHALGAAMQKNTQPVQKITIVPRTMGSLGYTMQMPEEEKFLMTKDEIVEQIVVLLAGRAAEEIVFNLQTTGASNDIERATKLARSMISMYGMSEKFGMMGLESIESRYLDGRPVTNCSPETATLIDEEVRNVLDDCHKKAKDILLENREKLDEISEYLLQNESISGVQFMKILKGDAYIDEKEGKVKEIVKTPSEGEGTKEDIDSEMDTQITFDDYEK